MRLALTLLAVALFAGAAASAGLTGDNNDRICRTLVVSQVLFDRSC